MKLAMTPRGIIVVVLFVQTVCGSHFMGAYMSWAPASNNTITISYRITWIQSRYSCNEQTIMNRNLIGTGTMSCFSGCSGSVGSLMFFCTDFKAGEWSSGGNSINYTTTAKQFEFGFTGNAWYSPGSSWSLRATVDLSVRSTGKINSSPTVNMPPVLYWKSDCSHNFTLPVSDVDGDVIKCRKALGSNECGSICDSFPGLVLNETSCTISYSATSTIGNYKVALQIEDFVSKTSTVPFSSIPLQFLVKTYSGTGCSDESLLVYPTPETGKRYLLDIGQIQHFGINAKGTNPFHRVVTQSDVTLLRSEEVKSVNSSWYYIEMNITVTAYFNESGKVHNLCFYARDIIGVTSDTRCVTIQISDINNCASFPCENGGTCTDNINSYTCICIPGYIGRNCSVDNDECFSSPCENGGTCADRINGYECSCAAGYTGVYCSAEINECLSSPCRNNGNCSDGLNGYMCFCLEGYSGYNCETELDECISNPCQSGGSCSDRLNGYVCSCVTGYTGINCETDVNECQSHPCQNGANCTDKINGYLCMCVPGFVGINCEIGVNECQSNPCQNGASCTDKINGYLCTCAPGFVGTNCDFELNECQSNPCQNGGSCTDKINGYFCTCVPGFVGTNCEIDFNECQSSPCQNGATCKDKTNGYLCTCAQGLVGTNCDIDVNECHSSPCHNGASCTDEINGYLCTCMPGFVGTNCAIDVNECQSNPCLNGAGCTDKRNGYLCTCAPGFVGTNCDIDNDECISSPCENGGTCTDRINGYECSCAAGYTGVNCKTEINECLSSPCINNADCTDNLNAYKCFCLEGYTGYNCETELEECISNPCQFGGNCSDRINGYVCSCVTGYAGINCETDIDGLQENKQNFTAVIVGAVLGAAVIILAVFAAYKIFANKIRNIMKAHTFQENKKEKEAELTKENVFVNEIYENEIKLSEEETYVNMPTGLRNYDMPEEGEQGIYEIPEEDYVNIGACNRIESRIYETIHEI